MKILPIFFITLLHFFIGIYPILGQSAELLPLPKQVSKQVGSVGLNQFKSITYASRSLQAEANLLQQDLAKMGINLPIQYRKRQPKGSVFLAIEKVQSPQYQEEAYQLTVQEGRIILRANTPKGIFNATQTLLQLVQTDNTLEQISITDYPAFGWRGYMVDVGRNYQSVEQLKQQIDVMRRFKLNVFQFHLTEDVAWRLESKIFPQLNDPQHMTRQAGKFYTFDEVRDLIAFCRTRHIEFIPEIDMPGHSEAFTKAMGFTMQTPEGLAAVKRLLHELVQELDVNYVHIGGDEVKITNQQFMPEVLTQLEKSGKRTIGWEPGGNLLPQTIRQLWMRNDPLVKPGKCLESRHLYINHFDPFESVPMLYARQLAGRYKGDSTVLGGILCLWHDRNISHEKDLLNMNPVYPSMLTFAEKAWRGGGKNQWVTQVNDAQVPDFQDFERRLMEQRRRILPNLPFAYAPQSHLIWDLYGPFNNGGDVSKSFPIEINPSVFTPTATARGATVILRHWWSPMVQGQLPNPQPNTTWYATQRFWSDTDTVAHYWIGFNNISRSMFPDVPPSGQWDFEQSQVWLNGRLIEPPSFKNSSQVASLELPLADEGYEYRPPTRVNLRKGWNEWRVKVPIAAFTGHNWQNPPKWMFTVYRCDGMEVLGR